MSKILRYAKIAYLFGRHQGLPQQPIGEKGGAGVIIRAHYDTISQNLHVTLMVSLDLYTFHLISPEWKKSILQTLDT